MHAALLKKGLPCALKMYQGEQHGFRKAENIEDALNSELFFFSSVSAGESNKRYGRAQQVRTSRSRLGAGTKPQNIFFMSLSHYS